MKIGTSYWGLEGGPAGTRPVKDAMLEARDLGFDSIELAIASSGVLTPAITRQECEEISAYARRIGIEISSLASGESWSASPTAAAVETRAKITAFTRKALEVARYLGVDAYLFVPGAVDVFFLPDGEVVSYDVCYERAQETLRALIPTAEAQGVTLCLENVWNKFLLSPLEMRGFIDGFATPAVGAYFDVGNVLLTGYPDQWIRILGGRIKRVHVKDFKRSIGTADGFCDLLEGDVDFEAVKRALAAVGYDGYVTAEIMWSGPQSPVKTAAAMKKIFK